MIMLARGGMMVRRMRRRSVPGGPGTYGPALYWPAARASWRDPQPLIHECLIRAWSLYLRDQERWISFRTLGTWCADHARHFGS